MPTARVTEPTSCRRSGWSTSAPTAARQVSVIAGDDPRTEQEAARPLVPRHLRGSPRRQGRHLGRRTATQARARQLSDGVVLAHEIRTAMVRPNREPLAGEVEIDESYVGGPEPGQPGRAEDKAIVAAAVEKRGKSCGRGSPWCDRFNVSADVLTAFVDNHLYLGHGRNRSHRRLAAAMLGSARPAIATSSRCCRSSIRPRPRCCRAFI